MGVPTTEEEEEKGGEQATSPSTFAPELSNIMSNHDNDFGFIELPKKKKIFSSSSFYEEPNAIYPTMEEQVEMCRKIADSLSDDCNKKSKGANMFFKRVKRAEKWVVPTGFGNENLENNVMDPASMPYVKINKEPPKLKLILDPRHIIDLKQLQQEGVQIVEHNVVSKNLCQNIVNDLNSPTGKGAQLFAKRKKKSMDWVVDEEKVREHLKQVQDRERGIFTPEPPQALIGNGTFIRADDVAETVIRAAETKIMSYPAPRRFAIEPVHYYAEPAISVPSPFVEPQEQIQQNSIAQPAAQAIPPIKAGVYACRGPRGWASPTPPRPVSMIENKCFDQDVLPQIAPTQSNTALPHSHPVTRTYSFNNFNITPKAWAPLSADPLTQVRKVRPPSLFAQ